jgi:hypothetical protein
MKRINLIGSDLLKGSFIAGGGERAIKPCASTWLAAAAACVVGMTAPVANAALLSYSFNMTAAAGSTLDLGSGLIDLTGVTYTITGNTTSDTDIYAGGAVGDGIGQFAAASVFSFGVLGSFATDASSDHYYFQNY